MIQSRILPPVLFFLTLVFVLSSCGKGKDDNARSRVQPYQSEVKLEDAIADQGCLSLPKLFEGIHKLNPELPLVEIPTAINFESTASIRENFRRLTAYGQLRISSTTVSSMQSLPVVSQSACDKVTVTAVDGTEQDFTVKSSARESLVAEAEDGSRMEYLWLSPRRIQAKNRFLSYDQPCSSGDKPVLVTVTKVFDWSGGGIPASVPASGSPLSIDADFLALAAQAVGDSADSLSAGGQIDLAKVAEMVAKPPKPEVVSCGNVEPTPDPQPTPNPTPNPDPDDDPDHPNHGGGGHNPFPDFGHWFHF
ncbi:MAG: hypothetical protein ACXVB9_04120 [Bdellovibrionota bacterium]